MRYVQRLALLLALAALTTSGIAAAAESAASYPNRPVRLMVPNAPGSSVDTLSRIVATSLSDVLGQQVVIDNRAGAAGVIAMEIAKDATPDGYTLISATTAASTIARLLQKKPTFHPVTDYDHVVEFAETANVLVVNPSVPVKSVKDFIAYSKGKPNEFRMASAGNGSQSHMSGAYFMQAAGFESLHVPYKGGGPSVTALVSGEAAIGFATMPSVLAQVKGGRLRGIAMTTAQRSPALPELPTVAESGIANFDVGSWYGLAVPAGTSRDIVSRLHDVTHKALAQPDVKEKLASAGFEVLLSTPEQFGEFVRIEVERWGKVVKASGAKGE
jgi:tripartite-type tricarboxylate transporter receptor subunit TctC